jgi:hypothetical protein
MSAAVVTRAVALSITIHETTHRRTLEGAVKEFVEVLASVPDYRPPELSVDGADVLKTLGEEVIARIELQLSAKDEPESGQRLLAEAVYDIRRELEELGRWRQHFFPA